MNLWTVFYRVGLRHFYTPVIAHTTMEASRIIRERFSDVVVERVEPFTYETLLEACHAG